MTAAPNHVGRRIALPAPAPPDIRVRVRWFLMAAASVLIAQALGQLRRSAQPDAVLAVALSPTAKPSTINLGHLIAVASDCLAALPGRWRRSQRRLEPEWVM